MKEIAEEPSLRTTGTVVEVDHPTRGKYLTVGNPVKMSDSITEVKRSPLLGEHTEEILTQVLGYSGKEIAEIKTSGAITRAGEGGEGRGGVSWRHRPRVANGRVRSVANAWVVRFPHSPLATVRLTEAGGSQMRIVVHGQQAFGKAVLEALSSAARTSSPSMSRRRKKARRPIR